MSNDHDLYDSYGDIVCRRCGRIFRGHWIEHPHHVPCDPHDDNGNRITPDWEPES